MLGHSEVELLRFLTEILVMLVVSRLLADIMKRFGQAPVLGELLAGIVLGKSLLGYLAPPAYAFLFSSDPQQMHLLESFAWVGAILLLLYIGLETDLGILRGMGPAAIKVSGCGIAVPLLSGLALGYMLPDHYLAAHGNRAIFSLFMAVAMSISAVPVIAKILIDLGLMRRELGLLILAAGIVDDSVGWLMLSIVAGLAARGTIDFVSVGLLIGEAALFIALCYFGGYRLVGFILRWVDDHTFIDHGKFSAIILIALVCAVLAQAIGLHAVFGAFVAGLMIRNSARMRKTDLEDLKAITLGVMAPLFFAYSGLKADPTNLSEPVVPLLVLAVACAGKLAGCGLGGVLARLGVRDSMVVAVGMNARGGMGIIVALVGLSLGVLTPEMYTIIIAMAFVTSLMAPPLLKWTLGRVKFRPSEAERLEREKLLARLPLSHEGAKLLVLSGGGPHADLAVHIAAALANHADATMTVFHGVASGSTAPSTSAFNGRFGRIKAIAEQFGARNILQRTATGDSVAETIIQESARGYEAIFAGASQLEGRDSFGGEVLRELVTNTHAPVVIVRDAGLAIPFKRILVPVTGAAFSRLGASLAMRYAQAFKSEVTALYVREHPPRAHQETGPGSPPADEGAESVEEIRRFGNELQVRVNTEVGLGRRPGDVILGTAQNGNYDLLVMGVLFRSSEQRLYFGPTVRQILRAARCSVALVVPPESPTPRA